MLAFIKLLILFVLCAFILILMCFFKHQFLTDSPTVFRKLFYGSVIVILSIMHTSIVFIWLSGLNWFGH